MPRIVSIFGATGNQGSSVLDAILADGTFTPRAITRNLRSDAAKRLKERGVEVVQGDHSLGSESLEAALSGSEAVFAVTIPFTETSEVIQGKAIIDASKAVGVKFLVWSSLPAPSKGYDIPHFAQKAQVDEYLAASKLPYAIMYTGTFIENLWRFGTLRKDDSGELILSEANLDPSIPMVFSWIQRDLGRSVLALFKAYTRPEKGVLGKKFYLASGIFTYTALADTISKGLGKPVTFKSIPTSGLEVIDRTYKMIVEQGGLYPGVEITAPSEELKALGVDFQPLESGLAEELMKHGF